MGLASELATWPAEDRAGGLDRALESLVSGLSAQAAVFYSPYGSAAADASPTRFARVQSGPGAEEAQGAEALPPVLPMVLDLDRLPDHGQALRAGQAQRVLFSEAAPVARGEAAALPLGWESLRRPRQTRLLVPCLGSAGLQGVLVVEGGLAAQRGFESMLSSVTLLGNLVAAFLERHRLETELQSLRQHRGQAERLEALGRVATSVAHDFNNVLTAIGGNAELLEMALPEDAKELTEVREISEATERAGQLVEEILSFARARADGIERTSLAALISRLENMTRRVAGNGINVIVDVPADLPSVEINPGRFERLLLNLASNARDAQPERRPQPGVLEFSARRIRIGADSESLTGTEELAAASLEDGPTCSRRAFSPPASLPAGEYLCLRVEDDGCGMDSSVRERVFEPFFTTKTEGCGTGLGLATCAEVMQEVGGAVALDSAPGQGAAFDLYFPVAPSERDV